MHKKLKKLQLSKETVRQLNDSALEVAAGGASRRCATEGTVVCSACNTCPSVCAANC